MRRLSVASARRRTAGPTTIASDDYARADSTTIGSTPVGGKAYSTLGTSVPAIISGTLGVNSCTSISPTVIDSGLADMTISATLSAIGTGAANQQGGLAFRVTDGSNGWWFSTRKDASTLGFDLYKVVAGTTTRVTTTGATVTPAAGQVLKVVCSGSTITAYVDGTQVCQSTADSFNSTATKVGFMFGASGLSTRWDNLSVTSP